MGPHAFPSLLNVCLLLVYSVYSLFPHAFPSLLNMCLLLVYSVYSLFPHAFPSLLNVCLVLVYSVYSLLASQSDAHTIAPHRDPTQSHPLIAPERKKGQTEQDLNAGVRLTIQNWDIR